jgi:hypothetical protein
MKVKTVLVNRGGVAVRINEAAYRPYLDELWREDGAEAVPVKAAIPDSPPPLEVEIIPHPGGWYTVEVNGEQVTDKKVRKAEAEATAAKYR